MIAARQSADCWQGSCRFVRRVSTVLRAAVLSIALALAVGPSAVLLCPIRCDTQGAATMAGCPHQDPLVPLRVSGADSCNTIADASITFVREDVRRGTFAPDAQGAVLVPWVRFAPPPAGVSRHYEQGQLSPLEARPLAIALRL